MLRLDLNRILTNNSISMATKKKRPFLKKNHYEEIAWAENRLICGIDEVGRGCLAGSLVTAAVILPPNTTYRLLKDSKEMTHEERVKAAQWITKNCYYGYGIVHHRMIDAHNIWHATLIGMRRAVMNLLATCPQIPHAIVIDAMPLKLHDTSYADIPLYHFPFGEKKSSSIAAASILAKVKRDTMMHEMDKQFPNFAWHSNKGYGTVEHKTSLTLNGSVIVHRKSFLKNLTITTLKEKPVEEDTQQTLFAAIEKQEML